MGRFDYLYGKLLGQLVLNHVDNLSSMLQHKSMSAAEGQVITKMTVETLKSIRDDEYLDQFWECTKKKAEILEVDEPRLPQQCKLPLIYLFCTDLYTVA